MLPCAKMRPGAEAWAQGEGFGHIVGVGRDTWGERLMGEGHMHMEKERGGDSWGRGTWGKEGTHGEGRVGETYEESEDSLESRLQCEHIHW